MMAPRIGRYHGSPKSAGIIRYISSTALLTTNVLGSSIGSEDFRNGHYWSLSIILSDQKQKSPEP